MPERRGLLDEVVDLPWWVGVILAVIAFFGIRYMGTTFGGDDLLGPFYAQIFQFLAMIVGAGFLLAAFISLVRSLVTRRRQHSSGAAVAASGAGTCPSCGKRLVLRKARRGANVGERFWGCSSYPTCRYTRPYN